MAAPAPSGLTHVPDSASSSAVAIVDAPMIKTSSRDISDLFASVKRTARYASAGAAVVALAIAGSNFGSSGPSESEHTPTGTSTESNLTVVTPASNAKPQVLIGAPAPEVTRSGSRSAPVATATTATHPTRTSDAPAAMPSAPVTVPNLRRLVVQGVATPSLDSLMRTAVQGARDAESEPIAGGGSLLTSAHNDDASVTPPVLIAAPTPRYPDDLRTQRLDGEVVVQFRVNDKGRVDASSMQVVQSQHELFTAAVRNVLPRFRFEPARSASPGSKPQSAWVQFRAQFNARN